MRTFDVAVQDAVLVAVRQTLQQLLHETLDLRRREALPPVREAGQVVVAKLQHHVDCTLALIVLGGCDRGASSGLMCGRGAGGPGAS